MGYLPKAFHMRMHASKNRKMLVIIPAKNKRALVRSLPETQGHSYRHQLSYLSTRSPQRALIEAEMQLGLEQYDPVG